MFMNYHTGGGTLGALNNKENALKKDIEISPKQGYIM